MKDLFNGEETGVVNELDLLIGEERGVGKAEKIEGKTEIMPDNNSFAESSPHLYCSTFSMISSSLLQPISS